MTRSVIMVILSLTLVSCSGTGEELSFADQRQASGTKGRADPYRPTWQSSGQSSVVPLLADKTSGLLIVTASVNGVQGRFLLDTGASASVISSEFTTRLGLSTWGFSAVTNIEKELRMARVTSLQIGKEVYRDFCVVVLDLSHYARVLEAPVDGVMGVNLLKQSPFSIDIGGACLSLNITGLNGSQVPIAVKNDGLYMDVDIDGIDSIFRVDTGANNTRVTEALWSIVSQGKTIEKYRGLRFDANRVHELDWHERIPVKLGIDAFGPLEINVRNRTAVNENLLGLDAMSSFVITFDIAKGMSYWTPAGTHSNKALNRSGGVLSGNKTRKRVDMETI